MGDLSDMIGELLKNPETMSMVREIAGSLSSGGNNPAPDPGAGGDAEERRAERPGADIDPAVLLKVLGTVGAGDDDPRIRLLNSLKPYLSPKRGEHLESAVKILRYSRLAELFKEKGK